MPPRPDVSAERRAQIIQAALACFARKGYSETTMDDIVTESGLSKGSLYWYFDSKEELFSSALLSLFEDYGRGSLAAVEGAATAADKLRALGAGLAAVFGEIGDFINLLVEFWAQSTRREELNRLWTDLLLQYRDTVVEIVEEGVRNGEFRPVDAENLMLVVMAAYDGLAVYGALIPGVDAAKASEVFIETLLSGLEVER